MHMFYIQCSDLFGILSASRTKNVTVHVIVYVILWWWVFIYMSVYLYVCVCDCISIYLCALCIQVFEALTFSVAGSLLIIFSFQRTKLSSFVVILFKVDLFSVKYSSILVQLCEYERLYNNNASVGLCSFWVHFV